MKITHLPDRRARLPLVAFALGALALSGVSWGAADAPVDPERQSSVFKRIFSYDKDLRNSEKIVVIVVSPARDGAEAQRVAEVFRKKGLYPAIVATSDLSDDLTGTLTPNDTVIYVTDGVDTAKVMGFAASKGFLTISGQPSMAEAGHVSVSVDLAGDRPQIVVNMPRLQTERHELSAELLNLARVIR